MRPGWARVARPPARRSREGRGPVLAHDVGPARTTPGTTGADLAHLANEAALLGVTTTGAENGLEQVTHLARGMVGGWGTSERAGRPTAVPSDAQHAYGLSTAPAAPDAVDSGMRRLADERCADALRLLEDHRDRPDALPQALLENETPGRTPRTVRRASRARPNRTRDARCATRVNG